MRVENGQTLTTDGPFVAVKEALGGYLIFEADDLDAAIELAARIPAARLGGAIEVRPDRGVVTASTSVFRDEWGRVLAALIGFLGSFDLAEEAAQEAFAIAAERWPREGTPVEPARVARDDRAQPRHRPHPPRPHARREDAPAGGARGGGGRDGRDDVIPDERLELLFTCCHPALALDAQVALTLRTLGGLTTDEIAARVPRARADDGQAARPREAQDRGGRASRSACRRRTCCPTGSPRCSRSST